jgi:hypothetical protein
MTNPADKKEQDAKIAKLFGDYEKSAALYAKAASFYWKKHKYSDTLRTVVCACESLRSAGMDDEVITGIRTVTIMFVHEQRAQEALTLSEYYHKLETQDPMTFRGGTQFSTFIKNDLLRYV